MYDQTNIKDDNGVVDMNDTLDTLEERIANLEMVFAYLKNKKMLEKQENKPKKAHTWACTGNKTFGTRKQKDAIVAGQAKKGEKKSSTPKVIEKLSQEKVSQQRALEKFKWTIVRDHEIKVLGEVNVELESGSKKLREKLARKKILKKRLLKSLVRHWITS
nr:hypothetical protein [Tanacetum cinerariifolium]